MMNPKYTIFYFINIFQSFYEFYFFQINLSFKSIFDGQVFRLTNWAFLFIVGAVSFKASNKKIIGHSININGCSYMHKFYIGTQQMQDFCCVPM